MDSSVELKIHINMNLHIKRIRKKSIQENEGHLPVVPYCTKHRNKYPYAVLSCPTDSI